MLSCRKLETHYYVVAIACHQGSHNLVALGRVNPENAECKSKNCVATFSSLTQLFPELLRCLTQRNNLEDKIIVVLKFKSLFSLETMSATFEQSQRHQDVLNTLPQLIEIHSLSIEKSMQSFLGMMLFLGNTNQCLL